MESNAIYFTTKNKLREWFEKHHASEQEVWLIYYKKNSGKPTISYEDSLDEALCFGWIDGKMKSIDSEKYMVRFTPRREKSQWSANNVKRYKKLLTEGLLVEAGKKAFEGKGRIYRPILGKKPTKWHLTHKMPKNPTLEQRIAWHLEHQKHCGCRPITKDLRDKN